MWDRVVALENIV